MQQDNNMLFGKKVTPAFRTRVAVIADKIGVTADDLMLCMAWETGASFSPSVVNAAGSGAVGLIQFMPQTAAALGTSTRTLAGMTAIMQLDFVEMYFRRWEGRIRNLGDLYMAIIWPAGVGRADNYVLFDNRTGPTAYAQNRGLDFNRDGEITRGEAYAKVAALRPQGKEQQA